MEKALIRLVELQNIDLKLDEIVSLRGDLPHQVDRLNRKLQEAKDEMEHTEEQLEACKKDRHAADLRVKELNEKKEKYQAQLYEVKNNREYDAISMEIEAVKIETGDTETIILECIEKEESLNQALAEQQALLEQVKEEFEIKNKNLQELISKTEKDEIALRDQREKIVRNIDRRLLHAYERIRRAKQGKAIVPVVRRACGGCFKALPPQKVLEVRKMNRIILCEVCGRILVWDDKRSEIPS